MQLLGRASDLPSAGEMAPQADTGPQHVDEDRLSIRSLCSSDTDSAADSDVARRHEDDNKGLDGDQSCGVGLALRLAKPGQSATWCGAAGPVVVVEWVAPGGAAASSGVVKPGDVLLSVREANGLVNITDQHITRHAALYRLHTLYIFDMQYQHAVVLVYTKSSTFTRWHTHLQAVILIHASAFHGPRLLAHFNSTAGGACCARGKQPRHCQVSYPWGSWHGSHPHPIERLVHFAATSTVHKRVTDWQAFTNHG
jgi:hypothetical protein